MGRSGEGKRASAPEEGGAKERLLVAAAQLWADRGYHSISVREICAAAEVTKPTLYYYFGSKVGLAKALLDDAADELLVGIQRIVGETAPLREKLKGIARLVFDRSSAVPKTCRFFYASMFAPTRTGVDQYFDEKIPPILALTVAVFEDGRRSGEIAGVDPEFAAMLLLGALQAYVMRFVRKWDGDLTPALADRIVDAVLSGLCPTAARRQRGASVAGLEMGEQK